MATHQQVKNKLETILCHDNEEEKKHNAVAIIGEWGIGKTYLWEQFYNSMTERQPNTYLKKLTYQKYAYVSLFGINSLEELKLKIATEIVSTEPSDKLTQNALKKPLRQLGGILKNVRFSGQGFTVGISSSVLSNLIMADMKDTLVCLDDLERRSQDLPIDEVMGLVNYLVSEKSCSVVCLLNKGEINDEQYENYKEKVFTNELLIDQSLDIVIEQFKRNNDDDFGVEIIERFYSIFEIKNIRFYKRVFKLYQSFIKQLGDENTSKLSNLSKENIFSSFLLLTAFDVMPKVMRIDLDTVINKYSNENYIEHILSLDDSDFESLDRKVHDKISRFRTFFKIDTWEQAIIKFIRSFEVDSNISYAINDDLFSEESLANKRELKAITQEYYNLELKTDFSQRLTDALLKNLKNENYENLNFWCLILEEIGRPKDTDIIVEKTKQRINEEIDNYSGTDYLNDAYWRDKRDGEDKFYDYIKERVTQKPKDIPRPKKASFFINELLGKNTKVNRQFVNDLSKSDLDYIIWSDISKLEGYSRRIFIRKVINHREITDENKEKYRKWVVDLLKEKAEKSSQEQKAILEMFLENTNELRKFD